jgi:hypothetical protein
MQDHRNSSLIGGDYTKIEIDFSTEKGCRGGLVADCTNKGVVDFHGTGQGKQSISIEPNRDYRTSHACSLQIEDPWSDAVSTGAHSFAPFLTLCNSLGV